MSFKRILSERLSVVVCWLFSVHSHTLPGQSGSLDGPFYAGLCWEHILHKSGFPALASPERPSGTGLCSSHDSVRSDRVPVSLHSSSELSAVLRRTNAS